MWLVDLHKLFSLHFILYIGLNYVLAIQPEFLRSFILRPWMLSNTTLVDPPTQQGPVTLSLYIDNWSPYTLVLASKSLQYGTWEMGLEPKDMNPKSRNVVFRTMSSESVSGVRSSGVVGWTLTNGSDQPTQFTIAWDIGNGGVPSRFSSSFGSFVPTREEMWLPAPKMISKGLTSIQSSNQLDDTVYLSQPKVALAAVNMTLRNSDGLHYKIFVSLIPPNVDVWGWVKYYHHQAVENPKPLKEGQQEDVASKKHLLHLGKALKSLDQKNLTLRGSLSKITESILVAIHIENWSRFPLNLTQLTLLSGKTLQSDDQLAPPPSSIEPGAHDFGVILQSSSMSGTYGLIRWNIGSLNKVLSLMWSVPYNRQLWRSWVAVGITYQTPELPTFDEMYSGNEVDQRFVRRRAGHQFEFSDGQFIIVAEMDSDATFKPVLHLVVAPISSELLAPSVRTQLGMKNIKELESSSQKNDDTPTVSHIHSASKGSGFSGNPRLILFLLLFYYLHYVICKNDVKL